MLYLIPTPIGNLKDWTYRAVETVASLDYALCEDTRTSAVLLNHYELKVKLLSYHQFNEKKLLPQIIEDLQQGKNIGLLSDAGSPLICDPGQFLVEEVIKKHLPFTSLPGPCAFITALTMSGKLFSAMQFLGFYPEKNKDKQAFIFSCMEYPGISCFYIAPHDVQKCLQDIKTLNDQQTIIITREISKKFEERLEGTPSQLIEHFDQKPPKGEFVFCIEGMREKKTTPISSDRLMNILTQEHNFKVSLAAKIVASVTGENRKTLYNKWNDL